MDLVDLMVEKRFLGQEFLTWLWFKSEERGQAIALDDSRTDVSLVFEKFLLLESGEGDSLERVTVQGGQAEFLEGRLALRTGKKVEQARMMLIRDDHEFHFTLSGSLFEFKSVRLPKTMAAGEEGDGDLDVVGRCLDQISLYEVVARTVDELFRMFLRLRIGKDWAVELGKVGKWIDNNN